MTRWTYKIRKGNKKKEKIRSKIGEGGYGMRIKNEENNKRAREIVCCAGCKKYVRYGSMYPHKKTCKGIHEPTPLERLRKLVVE